VKETGPVKHGKSSWDKDMNDLHLKTQWFYGSLQSEGKLIEGTGAIAIVTLNWTWIVHFCCQPTQV